MFLIKKILTPPLEMSNASSVIKHRKSDSIFSLFERYVAEVDVVNRVYIGDGHFLAAVGDP